MTRSRDSQATRPVSVPPFFVILVIMILIGISLLIGRVFIIGDQEPAPGGVYTEAVGGSPVVINPLFSQFNDVDRDLVSLIFSGLTRLDGRWEVKPDLAQSWEVSPDGRSYTFTLRPNARWHDGRPVVADDVVFTLKAIQDPGFRGFPDLASFWRAVQVDKVDDRRVRLTQTQPFAPLPAYTTIGILPRHVLGGVAVDKLAEQPFNVEPIGSGPFKFSRGTIEGVTLDANTDFYRGRPYLDRIILRFFPDDQSAVTSVIRKETDGLLMRPITATTSLARLEQDQRLRTYTALRSSYLVMFLNNRDPLFVDPRVRQAMSIALDRNELVRDAAGGLGAAATSPLLPNTWAFEPVMPETSGNRERAAQLLDEAGWRMGPGEVREQSGRQLSFTLLTDDDPVRVQAIQTLSRQLARVGVRAELSISGYAGLIQNFMIPRRYQAIVYGLDLGYDPDPYVIWHSTQAREDGFNFSNVRSNALDALMEVARKTSDLEQRKQYYREFQQEFVREMPSVILYYPTYSYVMDRRIRGVEVGTFFEPASRFSDVTHWYVNTQRRQPAPPSPTP